MKHFSRQQVRPEDMPSAIRAERDRLRERVTELEMALKQAEALIYDANSFAHPERMHPTLDAVEAALKRE